MSININIPGNLHLNYTHRRHTTCFLWYTRGRSRISS